MFQYDKETGKWQRKARGNIKIIRNLSKRQFRVIVIEDQICTLCANHTITSNMRLLPMSKSDRMVYYEALDVLGEKMEVKQFAIKFKNKQKALQFLDLFNASQTMDPEHDIANHKMEPYHYSASQRMYPNYDSA
ncbi:unnamed protein product, partial [Lymnaea stagnalis]